MLFEAWILFLLAMTLPDAILGITTSQQSLSAVTASSKDGRTARKPRENCRSAIESAMDLISKRNIQQPNFNGSFLDLAGYALHQPLRSAPYDMYVTEMRIKMPAQAVWFEVEHCQWEPRKRTLETRLGFSELSVTGAVKLYEGDFIKNTPHPLPTDVCNVTMRMKRAGLQIAAQPRVLSSSNRGIADISMDSQFLQPEFVSVYVYGCHPPGREHREESVIGEKQNSAKNHAAEDTTQEMEQVFLKGIQSLLKTYLGKQLQQTMKNIVMRNMGYTVSYGR
ncbi:uncharacterized protein LOC126473882 isoform X1 [Schistocerca serialis cubense]|uniref:uncharacterized protein LOC126473882 isoform X1 n=1 Tax=Schistocerca serialis cubense TaxID=2023355 RepID=UPI00214E3862|nr:uncharacterized protein LOC126473882 isoform X1 [Schistocerca serialis cubense]